MVKLTPEQRLKNQKSNRNNTKIFLGFVVVLIIVAIIVANVLPGPKNKTTEPALLPNNPTTFMTMPFAS